MKIRDILREDKDPNLRGLIVDILEKIYFEASGGEDMTDDIVDKLGDYFTQVQQSQDPELQMAYEEMRDRVDTEPEEQAVVALAGIRLLMGPGYRPRPRRPLDAQGQDWVNNIVAQFDAALKKANVKTGPEEIWGRTRKHTGALTNMRIQDITNKQGLDEISDELLARYKEKAKADADELEANKEFRRATDRRMGVFRATGKQLAKTTDRIHQALNPGKKD